MTGKFRILLLSSALLATPALAADEPADVLIEHGRVYTADGSGTFKQAVAIKDGRILAVGTDVEMARHRGPTTKVIDAKGSAVVPGLIDTHTHLMGGAAALEQLNLTGVRTGAELAAKLRAYAQAHPELKVVEATGYIPLTISRFEFDDAAGGRPIVIRIGDWHSVIVNSAALKLAGLSDADAPDPFLPRDKQGRLTGLVMEGAQARIDKALPKLSEAAQQHRLALAEEAAHAAGVTTAVVVGGQDDLNLFARARDQGKLGLRITFSQWLTRDSATSAFPHDFTFTEQDAEALDAIRTRFRSDAMLNFNMVKIMSDGVVESHTASMLAPYADQPNNTGDANYSEADLDRIVGMMDRRGWQIMLHALGDKAVRRALDSFELAAKANPAPASGRRHKIEHIETMDPAEVPRFGALNVTASMQPQHGMAMADADRSAERWKYLGTVRSGWGWPWKSIKQAGGRVAFGSDWPVVPLNIGPGARMAMTRLPVPPVPDQRLTMPEVIDGYTRDAAYSIFRDKDLGTLEPGKRADVVIFRDDIFAGVPEGDLPVRATLMEGRIVYCGGTPVDSCK
jgi:predicted amidohydrolase YtcJ